MKINQSHILYFGIAALINLVLGIYASPIIDLGDAHAYIKFSESFHADVDENFSHRSPLYSLMMAAVMWFIHPPAVFKAMIIIHYLLLGLTTALLYSIFSRLMGKGVKSFLAALVFNISFSTIYFADLIQTEILTVFLLMLSVLFLIRVAEEGRLKDAIGLGIASGLLVLCRFNTVPVWLVIFILAILAASFHRNVKGSFPRIVFAFLVPASLILNSWCLYNYKQNGFYGLFPYSGNSVSRNVIVASIRPENRVSRENQPILDIFLEAVKLYSSENAVRSKGSLSRQLAFGGIDELGRGYSIYRLAIPAITRHFGLPENAGEHELTGRLKGFYREIRLQNPGFIWKNRILSLVASLFASSNGALPDSYGNINLNIFPSLVFKVYSFLVVFVSLFVLACFPVLVSNMKQAGLRQSFVPFSFYLLVFSFWGVNFIYATAGDAPRFKFPIEPLLIGLSFYYTGLFRRMNNALLS